MKKIFTLLMLGCLFMTPAFAQDDTEVDETFEFIDAQGNVVPDGTELTCHDMNELNQISTGLSVKNTTNATAGVQVAFNILSMDEGSLSVCFPGNCMNFDSIGKFNAAKGTLAGSTTQDFQTEWVPTLGSYGKADVTFQLVHKGTKKSKWGGENATDETLGYGPTITVHFVYDATSTPTPTGIKNIEAVDNQTVTARYNLAGQRVNSNYKGVTLVKFANGKTIKVLK